MMGHKYNEIFKLKEMLEKAEIPFDFSDETLHLDEEIIEKFGLTRVCQPKYHIFYPQREKCKCSVIEGAYTFGGDEDLLEIRGLLTEAESMFDCVKGYMTADDVFERIKSHYETEENTI